MSSFNESSCFLLSCAHPVPDRYCLDTFTNERVFLFLSSSLSDCREGTEVDPIRAHLERVVETLQDLGDGETLLSLVPMDELVRPDFIRLLTMSNERIAEREATFLRRLAKLSEGFAVDGS